MDRVVVVDDNPINLELIELLLEADGFDVTSVTRAEDALALIERTSARLFLLDVQLPGMSGLDLLGELRRNPRTADACIVLVTSYAMDSDREKAFGLGCNGYITKPINTRTFASEVRRYFMNERRSATQS